jgi:methionyl-tRNA formyltransferase
VRAYKAFPRARLTVEGQDVIILQAHLSDTSAGPLDIAFKEGVLSIDQLVAPSGKTMTADAFIKGYLK